MASVLGTTMKAESQVNGSRVALILKEDIESLMKFL